MAHRDHVAIEIDTMLAEARSLFTTKCCIYRVPHEIRQLNKDAYTPQVRLALFIVEIQNCYAWKAPNRYIANVSLTDLRKAWTIWCVACERWRPRVRSCYSENIELGVDELVKVTLVDCGFVIELFHGKSNREFTRDYAIFSRQWLRNRIIWDLSLFENQLPFFVFEELYNIAFKSLLNDDQFPSFLQLAFDFYSVFNKGVVLPPPAGSILHFTDLHRNIYLQSSNGRHAREDEELTLRYSASELNEAGVKFTLNETTGHSRLDFQFSGRILKIPLVEVDDKTETWLRNMMAFEHCHDPADPYITNYVEFLDCLINTDKDVDVLVKHGIILNWLGDSNAVAELFNGLTKNTLLTRSNIEYLHICKELTALYENCWHTKKATLKRDYFNTPWKTVASIAGIAMLILTVIQTVYSILQVVQQV